MTSKLVGYPLHCGCPITYTNSIATFVINSKRIQHELLRDRKIFVLCRKLDTELGIKVTNQRTGFISPYFVCWGMNCCFLMPLAERCPAGPPVSSSFGYNVYEIQISVLSHSIYFTQSDEAFMLKFLHSDEICGYIVCICYRTAAVERITHQL
jgi:hypothetical protein